LSAGALFGIQVIPDAFYELGYSNMGLMLLAPGVFIVIGLLVWAQNVYNGKS
jgi:Na+-transporting NADH:ubiquinone oxidoreductase subunit D